MGLVENPKCRRYGEENKTSTHILCHWPALVKEREYITGYFFWKGRYCYQELRRDLFLVERSSGVGVVMWGTLRDYPSVNSCKRSQPLTQNKKLVGNEFSRNKME